MTEVTAPTPLVALVLALVPVLLAMIGVLQVYMTRRLNQQDQARDEARKEAEARGEEVKAEAARQADIVKAEVERHARELQVTTDAARSEATADRAAAAVAVQEIHVMVNSKLTEALDRVTLLEEKLGLASGEALPTAQVLTKGTPAPDLPAPDAPVTPPPAGP